MLALVALVACYAPTPPEGRPCSERGACPSELVCRAGVCIRDDGSADASLDDGALIDAPVVDGAPFDGASDAPTDGASPGCPATYVSVPGQTSRYRTVMTPRTWSEAEADCEADGVGMHLAVVDNASEHTAVDALTGASIWFGLTDRKVEGTPRWVTGATPSYTNYGGAGNETGYDCAGIYQSKWAWGECVTTIKYVCECDGIAAQASAY